MALTKHGIPFRPEYCTEVLNVSGDNTEAISSLLLQDEPPTTIVVSDDILAVSPERVCLQNLVATKIIVPHQLIERDNCCRIESEKQENIK